MYLKQLAKVKLADPKNEKMCKEQAENFKYIDKGNGWGIEDKICQLAPKVYQFIFRNRIGSLPYEVETVPDDFYRTLFTSQQINEIDKKRVEIMNGSFFRQSSKLDSPKKVNFMKTRFEDDSKLKKLEKSESTFSVNNNVLYMDNDSENEEEKFDKPNILVGAQARNDFWELFKSDRKFKDFNNETDTTNDPRFAYLSKCHELNIVPTAGQVMKASNTNAIDFTNKFLNSTAAVKSVAESIKRLAYTVKDAIIVNNSLKPKDSIILVESLQNHYGSIQVLDLSKNVIGPLGGSHLIQKLPQIRMLRTLKLAGCQITDKGLTPLFDIMTVNLRIEILDLSGNLIGQSSSYTEFTNAFVDFLTQNTAIEQITLSDNCLRGQNAENILKAISKCVAIQILSLGKNFLGESKGKNSQAPIVVLSSMLMTSTQLQHLDISFNHIDAKSTFCLSQALAVSKCIKSISVEGNSIGKVGAGHLMMARNSNQEQDFSVNMKMADGETDAAADVLVDLFDPNNPEGPFKLDLTKIYDQIILQNLLTISFSLAAESVVNGAPFDQKACFFGVKMDGKAGKWDPTTVKNEISGQWDLGEEPKGLLEFTFTCDPLEYKKEQQRINKEAAAAEAAGKPITDPKLLKPAPREVLTEVSLTKQVANQQEFQKTLDILLKNYQNRLLDTNNQVVREAVSKNSFWLKQSQELVKFFYDESQLMNAVNQLVPKIRDRHNRFAIVPLKKLQEYRNQQGDCYSASQFNPTGSYLLNLSHPHQREVAKLLCFLNKQHYDKIVKGEAADKSMLGTKCCFRNEKMNKGSFKWTPQWALPQSGILTFDFIYLPHYNRPKADDELDGDQFVALFRWFQREAQGLIETRVKGQNLDPEDEANKTLTVQEQQGLAEAFRCAADFITLSTKQLSEMLDAIEGPEWRLRVFLAGVGRCHDYTNIDFIKHKAKYPQVIKALYKQFGILNMFSVNKPDGTYLLNLAIYEEKVVAKLLCELCRAEGWALMTEIKLVGKSVDKLTPEIIKTLPDTGMFECKYLCPEDKVKLDAREKLGAKFLDWIL